MMLPYLLRSPFHLPLSGSLPLLLLLSYLAQPGSGLEDLGINGTKVNNGKLSDYAYDPSVLNAHIQNKQDQKDRRVAFRHLATGYFLSGYVSGDGQTSLIIPSIKYVPVQPPGNGRTVGIWDLDTSLLNQHKAQLLVLEYDVTKPNNTQNTYGCAQYSMGSPDLEFHTCAYDRSDKQMQQFIVDTDRANNSIVTIQGNDRKDCFGFIDIKFTAMSCDNTNTKFYLFSDSDYDPETVS